MRYLTTLLTLIIICTVPWRLNAQCNVNILINPDFDTPTQPSIGNNLLGVYTWSGWTMTGGPFNVIRTDGSSYGGGPDNAKTGNQYIDITNGAGILYQDFTITGSAAPVSYTGYFSSRETGYVDWTASIDIVNVSTNTVVGTSTTHNFTNADGAYPAQEVWYLISGSTVLPPGTYRYVANIGDFGNFDAATLTKSCILPVQLNSFAGNLLNDKVQLYWQAAYATNFSHYEVERSIDGSNFTSIGNVLPSANQQYNFIDNEITTAGKFYYRLKMVDKDARVSYSNIIIIKIKGILSVTVSPNPAINYLNVSGLKGNGEIKIFDITGKLARVEKVTAVQAISIDIALLNKGTYLMQYFNGETTTVQKFSKQ